MKRLKKVLAAALATVLVGTMLVGCAGRGKTVAVVNGQKISERLYRTYLWSIQQDYENISPDIWDMELQGQKAEDLAKERTLNAIITSVVIKEKAKEYKIKLTEEEKKYAADAAKAFAKVEANKQLLQQQGFTQKEIEQYFIHETLKAKVISKLSENYTSTEEEITKKMNELRESEAKVTAQHVLIRTTGDDGQELPSEELEKAKQRAEEILAKALAGVDMTQLAKDYSEDPSVVENGGEFTFGKGEMVAEFEQASFEGKDGEVYPQLVKTRFGYHIIKTIKHIEVDEEQLRKDSEQALKSNFASNELKELAEAAKVERTEAYNAIHIIRKTEPNTTSSNEGAINEQETSKAPE